MAAADILLALSWGGTAVFAVSGALMAMRKRMDLVGVVFLATVTGVGGGTLRDILLGAVPVAWVKAPHDIAICIAAGGGTMLLARRAARLRKALAWADAAGLALFAVLGTHKALAAGAHPFVAVLFGAVSASAGGIIRDVVCNEVPILLQREIYITAAILGGAVFVLLPDTLPFAMRAALACASAFGLRGLAIWRRWTLPAPRREQAPPHG
ncbi:MAG: trimeric intracellular cation channel family protein [Alphaproteobacteria bacterium]|nr:MAG: trimeric intracellular cation channel family protein [Alphaproteobacteria bacterium]